MTHSEQYTPDNCQLVGEWLQKVLPIKINLFNGRDTWHEDAPWWERHVAIPQLLREALAAEGVYVDQWPNPMIGSKLKLYRIESGKILEVAWDHETDRTARHALFAAVVEYLKTKESK